MIILDDSNDFPAMFVVTDGKKIYGHGRRVYDREDFYRSTQNICRVTDGKFTYVRFSTHQRLFKL